MSFDIYEIYLFNKSGALIAENIIENNINNQNCYKKVFPRLIKATALCDKKNNKPINHNIYFLQQRKIITVNFATTNVVSLAVCANETKSKLSKVNKGRVYVNNGTINIRVFENELDKYLQQGYIRGIVHTKKYKLKQLKKVF